MARRARALAAFSALCLVATACPRARPPQAPSTDPVPGGTLVVSLRSFDSFDPAAARTRDGFLAVAQVFDSLTAIDPETGAVKPAAAATWSSSRDGLRWRFTLAKATYHDGRPVRAVDFERAFDRITRRATRSDAAYQLEHVRGFQASRVTGRARTLAGVSSQGNVLRIRLDRPFAELPYFLSHPALAPLAPVYRRSTRGLATAPVGNGPFKVVEATPRTGATLQRYDGYRGPGAYLDGLQLTVNELDDGYRSLLEGRVDVADVPPTLLQQARARFGPEGFTPLWSTLSFSINLRHDKYRKPEVRRAISLAIDRNAIATDVYGQTGEPATGLVPRGVRGHSPDVCGSACTFDRPRAQRLVRAAFGRRAPRLSIDHLNDASSTRVARAIAGDLRAVGFRVSLRSYRSGEYERILLRRQDFAEVAWIADVPSPDGFLAHQLRSGSPENHGGFKDSRFDRAVDRARRTSPERARLRTYLEAERRALALMPLVPILFFRNRTVAADRVQGFVLDGAGLFDASSVWLQQA